MTATRLALLAFSLLGAAESFLKAEAQATRPSTAQFRVGEVLFKDDFRDGLQQWFMELENGGKVDVLNGELVIDVPAGCTVWFKPLIEGPVMIEYEATVISAGGPNDRVSDLNCFWMARDSRNEKDLPGYKRSGKFADYNQLRCYYVGLGGNGNTTTRFRRYIGDARLRPLLPEHDLSDSKDLITANVSQRLRLVAFNSLIQFYRDDRLVFTMDDPAPYTSGWFGFRTVSNHMLIRHFRVHRLNAIAPKTTKRTKTLETKAFPPI